MQFHVWILLTYATINCFAILKIIVWEYVPFLTPITSATALIVVFDIQLLSSCIYSSFLQHRLWILFIELYTLLSKTCIIMYGLLHIVVIDECVSG